MQSYRIDNSTEVEEKKQNFLSVEASFGAATKISVEMCVAQMNNNLTWTSSANKALDEGGRLEMKHSEEM